MRAERAPANLATATVLNADWTRTRLRIMCHPAVALVAATVGAAGQLQAGTYAARMARYEAQVTDQNKQRVRESTLDAMSRGQAEQRLLGREVAGRIGSQAARMASNNVDITFGSAARLIDDTRLIGREDSDALAENIRRQVSGMQTDIWNFESETRAKRAEASQAKTAAGFGALTTMLGGATQYADFRRRRGG